MTTNKLALLIGSDPEIFLKKGDKNVSAHESGITGTKRNPSPLGDGFIQIDGTALEFNTKPASTADEFAGSIQSMLNSIRAAIPQEYSFDFSPSVKYDREYFDAVIPQDCKELGCDPDYNAYEGGKVNPKPNPEGSTMRTGAGHLHLGWGTNFDPSDSSHIWDCCYLVQNLDRFFSPFEVLWDQDTERRNLYGKPGAFRPKSYGVEYRVLSNAWLKYPRLWPWIFNSTKFVFDKTVAGEKIHINYYARGDIDELNDQLRYNVNAPDKIYFDEEFLEV